MTCGKNSHRNLETDDLSSISCISRHFLLETDAQTVKGGSRERFENEFDDSKRKEPSSIHSTFRRPEGNDAPRPSALPTELFLPFEWCNSSSRYPSSTSSWCKIPHLRQYPPVLRALFVICFICILCAIGLILFAVVMEARGGSQTASSMRPFDISDWGDGGSSMSTGAAPSFPSGSDIFVQAPAASPTVGQPSGSTQSPTLQADISPVFYTTPPPPQLPQTNMAKKKQMGLNKEKDKEGKDDQNVKEKEGKDNDRRNLKRQRRVREMKPSIYPNRRESWW